MRKTFSSRSKIILVIAVILAAILLIFGLLSGGNSGGLSGAVNTVLSPVRKLVSSVSSGIDRLYEKNFQFDALEEENRQLKIRIAELEEDARSNADLIEENERLKKLLNFSEDVPSFEFESASVVSWSSSNWSSDLTLSKGTASGLEIGDCVITEEGALVGIISDIGTNWATVTTLVDSNSGIGALVSGSGATCVALGDLEHMQNDQLKATYFSKDSDVHTGDTLLTSGSGGIYPPNVVIGTVVSVENDPATSDLYTVVEPAADLRSISAVYIITAF